MVMVVEKDVVNGRRGHRRRLLIPLSLSFYFYFLTFRLPSFFDWVRVRESGVGKLGALDLSTRVVLFLLDFSRPLGLDLAANTVSFFKRNFSPQFFVYFKNI